MSLARFRAPWWASLLVIALSALMIALGLWQLQRGAAKQALQARYAQAALAPAQPLAGAAQAGEIHHVRVSGQYLPEQQLLLDNQAQDGRPGYHLWTPLRTDDDRLVMVDRGWLARDVALRPQSLAAPAAEQSLDGYWRSLPVPGMQLANANCAARAWPRVVQYPTLQDLRCLYPQRPVAEGILLLDAAAPGGHMRNWQAAPELNPAKHWGYAFQWFAFTVTLWVLFVRLNWRRSSQASSRTPP